MSRLHAHAHRLLVVVGASGAGKDSVLRGWLESLPSTQRPHLVRRTITRLADGGSEDHESLDESEFCAARETGAFAFAWQAHALHYGIRWSELEPLGSGRWVVMNGSRAHLAELRALAPRARVLEVVAAASLRQARLEARARESGRQIASRVARDVGDVGAELRIANDGTLGEAIAQLDAWWRPLASRAT